MNGNRITAQIHEGLAQAQRGEFVSDKEMELFFTECSEPSTDARWINEYAHRSDSIDQGKRQLIDVDEVTLKYRQQF